MTTDRIKIAEYFMQQCIGGSDGHMAVIPHNPSMKGFIQAFCHYSPDRIQFAKFLDEMSTALKKEHKRLNEVF